MLPSSITQTFQNLQPVKVNLQKYFHFSGKYSQQLKLVNTCSQILKCFPAVLLCWGFLVCIVVRHVFNTIASNIKFINFYYAVCNSPVLNPSIKQFSKWLAGNKTGLAKQSFGWNSGKKGEFMTFGRRGKQLRMITRMP